MKKKQKYIIYLVKPRINLSSNQTIYENSSNEKYVFFLARLFQSKYGKKRLLILVASTRLRCLISLEWIKFLIDRIIKY